MITQQQDNPILPEEQAQSNVEEKQTPSPEQKGVNKDHTRVKWLVTGSVVLLLAAAIFPYASMSGMNESSTVFTIWMWIGGVFVFICSSVFSGLARSLWTFLLFPILTASGLFMGVSFLPFSMGDVMAAWAPLFYMPLFPTLALIGAGIGTIIGVVINETLKKKQAR